MEKIFLPAKQLVYWPGTQQYLYSGKTRLITIYSNCDKQMMTRRMGERVIVIIVPVISVKVATRANPLKIRVTAFCSLQHD